MVQDGSDQLLAGLFYPEMALAAAKLSLERSVFGARNIVWGTPVRLNGKPCDLSVEITQDNGEYLYIVVADGAAEGPCQVGELMVGEQVPSPEPLDVGRAHLLLNGRQEYRNGGEVLLQLRHDPGTDDPLDIVWRRIADRHLDEPRLPYAMRSIVFYRPVPAEFLVKITLPEPAEITLCSTDGNPCIAICGLVTSRVADLAPISLFEEVAQ